MSTADPRERIFEGFLSRQLEDARNLNAASDLVELQPLGGPLPDRYLVRFRCRGLVREHGHVREHDDFVVGIRFPADYLHVYDAWRVVIWLEPANVFHPNVQPPGICLGWMQPATDLRDLVHQCFDIISFNKLSTRDPLNQQAAAWALAHPERFPVDRRPLRRRRLALNVRPKEAS